MRSGGCQCGQVRFQCAEEPQEIYICHCTECRRQSASAFGISFIVSRTDFQVLSEAPRLWRRAADSGRNVECAFCSGCGSRIWHQSSGSSATISVKGGSLDEAVDLSRATHIWTSSKLPGVVIPDGATQFPREPR